MAVDDEQADGFAGLPHDDEGRDRWRGSVTDRLDRGAAVMRELRVELKRCSERLDTLADQQVALLEAVSALGGLVILSQRARLTGRAIRALARAWAAGMAAGANFVQRAAKWIGPILVAVGALVTILSSTSLESIRRWPWPWTR